MASADAIDDWWVGEELEEAEEDTKIGEIHNPIVGRKRRAGVREVGSKKKRRRKKTPRLEVGTLLKQARDRYCQF